MSDEAAIELGLASITVDQNLLKLEKQYYKKFQKILPGKKVLRYFQVENKVKALIDAQMALEIPLVEN